MLQLPAEPVLHLMEYNGDDDSARNLDHVRSSDEFQQQHDAVAHYQHHHSGTDNLEHSSANEDTSGGP